MNLLLKNNVIDKCSKLMPVFFAVLFMVASPGKLYAEEEHGKNEAHEEHDGEEGHIELTPEQLKNANITLAQAQPATVRETLPLYGVVMINSERVQNMSARFPGVIRAIHRKVGETVRPGDSLAIIESNESLKPYTLSASHHGVITERPANAGEQSGDRTLFVVADLSSVWVEMAVFPRDMAKVRIGQTVRIQQAQTGLSGEGKLIYLSPSVNSASQTLTARVLLDNRNGQWVTGLFVSAEVTLAQSPVAVAVNNEALQTLENSPVVFVQGKEGFEPRPVQLGKSDSAYTEVLNGISVGETYAAHNSFILKSDLGKEGAEHGH